MNLRIPLAKPEITDSDREAALAVLRTPHLSMGPKVREFEQAICEYTGAKHAVAVNSGTSALHLAIRALAIERGSEVILPSFTFSALLNVILQEGLQPKFVDIDPTTYNTTPEIVRAAINPRTRLVLGVHTFGIPVDVEGIRTAVEQHQGPTKLQGNNIHLIEDACEALGTDMLGRKAGTLGDAGLFAFYPNKQVTTGEGGMLVTSNEQIAVKASQLRNQGRDPALGWNNHSDVGFSYRLSDINCALGISQLERIESTVQRRQELAEIYSRKLASIEEIIRPPATSKLGRISWFVFPVQLRPEFGARERDQICESLLKQGIGTGCYFAPLHRQPVLHSFLNADSVTARDAQERGLVASAQSTPELPNTEALADRVFVLPFFNELKECEVQEVCRALKEAMLSLR
jgi:perosamine synthetase